MADTPYNRWQGLAIAQLSVAVALVSAVGIAGLGAALSLLQSKDLVVPLCARKYLAAAMGLDFAAVILSSTAVLSRTLDFRLTARKVRSDSAASYGKSLTIFWIGPDGYGRLTWCLFWPGSIFVLLGTAALARCIALTFWDKLF
jgi:hypothetical protein